ncbi:MAG: hypothetical protein ACJ731_06440 [Vicinamibacterales bacterium]
MRPVSGFERPALQWLFVGLGLVLIATAAAEGIALRRARTEIAALHASDRSAQIEIDALRARAAREQAARERLTLELAHQRGAGNAVTEPTLTLTPLIKRAAQPPEPTVTRPGDRQLIQLRLVLPARAGAAGARYTIVIRTWRGGDAVWSRGGLSMTTVDTKPMVTSFLTGDVFAPGAYEVALARTAPGGGASDVAAYEIAIRP